MPSPRTLNSVVYDVHTRAHAHTHTHTHIAWSYDPTSHFEQVYDNTHTHDTHSSRAHTHTPCAPQVSDDVIYLSF
jgi:hypothetical protein